MSPVQVHPYGEWSSPVAVTSLTSSNIRISQVRIDAADTYWVEEHSGQNGRNVLLQRNSFGEISELLPLVDDMRLIDVRTRVNEYGGRAYAVLHGIIVFSDGTDGRVYRYDATDPNRGLVPLTPYGNVRYGDFEIDEIRAVVYAAAEDHTDDKKVLNTLVAIPLDGSAARDADEVITLVHDSDFVTSPALSPDGTKIAWISWDHPNMPWTCARLNIASFNSDGSLAHTEYLVNAAGVSASEPRWTLSGDLIHVDNSTGWNNLYRTEGLSWQEGDDSSSWVSRLRTRPLHPGSRSFSRPAWILGLHSYDNFDNQHLVCSWLENGSWHIGTVEIDNGLMEEWSTGWWPVSNVAASEGRVIFLADSATKPESVIEVHNGNMSVLRSSSKFHLGEDYISHAQLLTWPTSDGQQCHGFYYAPTNPNFTAPEGALPPLIVSAHGGPTSAVEPGFQLEKQFWTTRGFAYLDVNYRGSTDSDKNYRDSLNGSWGITDVLDCADGARHMIKQGLADPARIAIRGGSAGGYTVLQALATTDVFTAGTALYGVSDLRKLCEDTHKFESHYAFGLIGSTNLDDPVWKERSPLFHTDSITAPILLLQGSDDHVVPPEQARTMYDSLRDRGCDVTLKIYEGEGHGFRRSDTRENALQSEVDFYTRVWGK